jgi:hypothetical protein
MDNEEARARGSKKSSGTVGEEIAYVESYPYKIEFVP